MTGLRMAPACILIAAATAAACASETAATAPAAGQAEMTQGNTARDGNIAIREEFDRATSAGTVAGWELFLARHPGHPLAEEAAERLRQAKQAKRN